MQLPEHHDKGIHDPDESRGTAASVCDPLPFRAHDRLTEYFTVGNGALNTSSACGPIRSEDR